MPGNRNTEGESVLVILVALACAILAIIRAILHAIAVLCEAVGNFGRLFTERAFFSLPLLALASWIAYKVETSYECDSSECPLCLLKESKERAVAVLLGSGGVVIFSILSLLSARNSAGERAALGWLIFAVTVFGTYVRILFRHLAREVELKEAERRSEELEQARRAEERAEERERKKRRLVRQLGDLRPFLEDHYFDGALRVLEELEKEHPEYYPMISMARRKVKDAELAYHKARAEPFLQRMDDLLVYLDQAKQAKFS